MFCGKCGTKLSDKARFCKKCGTPTQLFYENKSAKDVNVGSRSEENYKSYDSIGTIPNSSLGSQKNNNKGKRKNKPFFSKQNKPARVIIKTLLIIIILFLFVIITGLVLDRLGVISIESIKNGLFGEGELNIELKGEIIDDTSYRVKGTDADEYFRNNSSVISEIEANKSEAVQTEQTAKVFFGERGFGKCPVKAEYTMEGKLEKEKEVDENSSEKHPMYKAYYQAATGDLWVIFSINGKVIANPVSYNLQSKRGVQVLISESSSVVSYDSTKNKFYETIPKETELIIKTVEEINASVLDSLSIKVIEEL